MHPALSLIGISEPEKTSYKSPWGFDGEGNEPKAVAQAETGEKLWGPFAFPWEVFIQEQIRKKKRLHG